MKTKAIILLLLPGCVLAGQQEPIDYDREYRQCIQDAGSLNNGTVGACSESVSESVKKEMADLYKKIYESLAVEDPEEAMKLERAQKSWITYRTLQCELAGAHVGSPMYSFCPMTLGVARVKELRELAGE